MLRGLLRVALLAAVAAGIGLPATAAHADPLAFVSGTGELGLALRSQPTVDSARLGTIPEGDPVAISCQTTGADVFGHPVWDQLESGGYVADWYVDTTALAPIPACSAPVPPVAEPSTPPAVGIGYDRAGAAQWAVAHAFDVPEIDGADCANFVSTALHRGGGLEITDWWRPWSFSWVRTEDLAKAMIEHGYLTRTEIDPSTSAIPGAELGDVVMYDTGDGGGFHHVSIIVRIDPSGTVEVSSHTNAYDYRVWNQSWLDREDRTGYRGHLLHLLAA